MSICASKIICKPVPKCLDELVIGAVTASTDVIVKLRNEATGRIEKFIETSDAQGVVKIGLTEVELISVYYSVKIFSEDLKEQLFISVEDQSEQEIVFEIEDCILDGELEEVVSVTLALK